MMFFLFTGGTLLTINGYGFDEGATVTMGTANCPVESQIYSKIVCRTPSVSLY